MKFSNDSQERLTSEWPMREQPQEHHSIELNPLTDNNDTIIFKRSDEIELVHRLDKRLLLFAMFGNLVKTLDNTNLGKVLFSY